jgi:hypothetical protein
LNTTVRQLLDVVPSSVGFTHASRVMPLASRREALSETVT